MTPFVTPPPPSLWICHCRYVLLYYWWEERKFSKTWRRRWAEVLEQVVLLHQNFSHSDRKWVKYAKFRHIIRPRYMYTKNYSISNVLLIMQEKIYMVWKWETHWGMGINVSDRHGLNIKMLVGSTVRNWNTRFIIFNNRTTTIRTPAPHTLSSAQSQKWSLEYMFKQLF